VRLVVSLALATIGCNPIFGLDPLTGRTDADLTDADPTTAIWPTPTRPTPTRPTPSRPVARRSAPTPAALA
jgi:hypothetical protein